MLSADAIWHSGAANDTLVNYYNINNQYKVTPT